MSSRSRSVPYLAVVAAGALTLGCQQPPPRRQRVAVERPVPVDSGRVQQPAPARRPAARARASQRAGRRGEPRPRPSVKPETTATVEPRRAAPDSAAAMSMFSEVGSYLYEHTSEATQRQIAIYGEMELAVRRGEWAKMVELYDEFKLIQRRRGT